MTNGDKVNGQGGPVQTVDRAIQILELLARRGGCRVTDVADEIGIYKSGAHRMLTTLAGHGMVERDPATNQYRLGVGLIGLASAVKAEIDVVRHAREPAQRLSEKTGETAIVTALVNGEIAILHQAASSASVLGVNWSSNRMPLHCTPSGKVLLAHSSRAERDKFLSASPERFTQNTVVEPKALQKALRGVWERGYAYTVEELEVGLNGVAAPIYGFGDQVVAAIGVYGPAFRLPEVHVEETGHLVMEAATTASRHLGGTAETTSHRRSAPTGPRRH